MGLGSLRKQHTVHISIVNIAQTEPQRKGTLASDLKGAGARAPPPPPLCTLLYIYIYIYIN